MTTRGRMIAVGVLAAGLLACGAAESTSEDSRATAAPDGSSSDAANEGGTGRRVFFAFGRGSPSDPQKMKDFLVDQVQKVATAIGSVQDPGFESTLLLGAPAVSSASVKASLTAYAQTLGADDTFVMYSHGHGRTTGLVLDFDSAGGGELGWKDLSELILALPAKNVLVFTMSCHAGALADLLKTPEYAARWQGRRDQGRSLVVMTAVAADEIASATDFVMGNPDTVGNPFTYAVRTAVDGQADGHGGAAADGRTTLREAHDYVLFTGKDKAKDDQHNPQFAGEFVEIERFPTGAHY